MFSPSNNILLHKNRMFSLNNIMFLIEKKNTRLKLFFIIFWGIFFSVKFGNNFFWGHIPQIKNTALRKSLPTSPPPTPPP